LALAPARYRENSGAIAGVEILVRRLREPRSILKRLRLEYIAAHEERSSNAAYGIAVYCGAPAVWREAKQWSAMPGISL